MAITVPWSGLLQIWLQVFRDLVNDLVVEEVAHDTASSNLQTVNDLLDELRLCDASFRVQDRDLDWSRLLGGLLLVAFSVVAGDDSTIIDSIEPGETRMGRVVIQGGTYSHDSNIKRSQAGQVPGSAQVAVAQQMAYQRDSIAV